MTNLTIEIASVPDRENLVAEIWDGDQMIAEITQEGDLEIQFFFRNGGSVYPLKQLLQKIDEAITLLKNG